MTTHWCPDCASPRPVNLVETTTMRDLAEGKRTFAWGKAERCEYCGSNTYPNIQGDLVVEIPVEVTL